MIWNKLPKGTFVGSDTTEFGVYDAEAHFNIGSEAAKNIRELGLEPGFFFIEGTRKADKLRVRQFTVIILLSNTILNFKLIFLKYTKTLYSYNCMRDKTTYAILY